MILDKIVEDKKVRLVEHKSRISPAEMRKREKEREKKKEEDVPARRKK